MCHYGIRTLYMTPTYTIQNHGILYVLKLRLYHVLIQINIKINILVKCSLIFLYAK